MGGCHLLKGCLGLRVSSFMININARVIASTFFNCRPGKPKEGINLSDGFVLSLGSNSVSNNTCSLVLLMETTQMSSGYIYI